METTEIGRAVSALRASFDRLAQLVPEAHARAVLVRGHARRLNELSGELAQRDPALAAELEEIAGAVFACADVNANLLRELTAWPFEACSSPE